MLAIEPMSLRMPERSLAESDFFDPISARDAIAAAPAIAADFLASISAFALSPIPAPAPNNETPCDNPPSARESPSDTVSLTFEDRIRPRASTSGAGAPPGVTRSPVSGSYPEITSPLVPRWTRSNPPVLSKRRWERSIFRLRLLAPRASPSRSDSGRSLPDSSMARRNRSCFSVRRIGV